MTFYHVLVKLLIISGMVLVTCRSLEAETIKIQTEIETIVLDISDVSAIRFEGDVSAEDMQLLVPILNAKLIQNHPNPFNPVTTISFELDNDSKTAVTLTIYNAKGQKVAILLNEKLSAGKHSSVWNGEDAAGKTVSSGIYFYQLSVNNEQSTKKMILIK